MNKQQVKLQIDFVRRELTRISQEMLYLEGAYLQTLRVRQNRLIAELDRLEMYNRANTQMARVYDAAEQPQFVN
jgi:hypothetical protein